MSDTAKRYWGLDADLAAGAQLGLDPTYTIFMMAVEAETMEGVGDEIHQVLGDDLVDASVVVDRVLACVRPVRLPKGFWMVGMAPLGQSEPAIYGVVDMSSVRLGHG